MNAENTTVRTEVIVTHRGKRYTLWMRGDNFYLRLRKQGRQIWKTLGTSLKEQAVKQAKTELDKLEKNDWQPAPKKPEAIKGMASVGDLVERYQAADRDMDRGTKLNYIAALKTLLRVVTGKEDPLTLPATILSEETLDAYIKAERGKGRPDHSIHASLTQARCIVSPKVMSLYKGLILPNLDGFRAKRDFKGDRDAGFVKFSREEAAAIETRAAELLAAKSPVWIAFAFMARLAMRNIDVYRAKWSDIVEGVEYHDGKPVEKRWIRVKANYMEALAATVEIEDDLWKSLQLYKPSTCTHPPTIGDKGEPIPCELCAHIIPAKTNKQREDICYRDICDRFRDVIVGRRKIAYELRRWAGSIVYTKHGSDASRQTLRHKSVVTAERYYAAELRGAKSASSTDVADIYGLTTQPTTQ